MTEKLDKYIDVAKLLILDYLKSNKGPRTRREIEFSVLPNLRTTTRNSTSLTTLAFIMAYNQLEQQNIIVITRHGLPPSVGTATDFNTTFAIAG